MGSYEDRVNRQIEEAEQTEDHQEAAVEAAAQRYYEDRYPPEKYSEQPEELRRACREVTTAVLDAALPHLEAEWAERLLSEEALDAALRVEIAGHLTGPKRSTVEAVLRAALEAIKEER